jgi:hypothetical protein
MSAVTVLLAAALGAGVVLAVHYGRPLAESTPNDCPSFSECLGSALRGDALLGLAVVAACLISLLVVIGARALLVVPVAFALQGLLMLVVEHVDGFWLPLPLDLVLGAISWASTAGVLTRVRPSPQGPHHWCPPVTR